MGASMRIFVTGGNGFLGSHLVSKLKDDGHLVVSLVRDYKVPAAYVDVTVLGNLSDRVLLERVLRQYEIDVVYHLASQTQVTVANESPIDTFESNIRGTWNLLEACRLYGKCKRVIVASSDKAYGPCSRPYVEDDRLAGEHPYDVSKSCADLITTAYHKTYGLPTVTARCSNLYGPGDMNWKRLIPRLMRHVFCGEKVTLRNNGAMKRDFLFVNDAVWGYVSLMSPEAKDGEAYNFSADSDASIRLVADAVLRIAGCNEPYRLDSAAGGEIESQSMDHSKATRDLGWRPGFTIAGGLASTIPWYGSLLGKGRVELFS